MNNIILVLIVIFLPMVILLLMWNFIKTSIEQPIDNMVKELEIWFEDLPKYDQDNFTKSSEDDLINYHSTFGVFIRNRFCLWDKKWIPVIVDGIDKSVQHPDNLSMQVIRSFWEKIQPKDNNI